MRRDSLALPWHSGGQYFSQKPMERLRASQVMLVLKNQPANAGDIRGGGSTLLGKISWRRKWQPTPVFSPGEFHGQRSLVGYSPWGSQRVRQDWRDLACTQHRKIQGKPNMMCSARDNMKSRESTLLQLEFPVKDFFSFASLIVGWFSGKNTGVGGHSLFQRIFQIQGSKPGLLPCRQILYHLSYLGSPVWWFTSQKISENPEKFNYN